MMGSMFVEFLENVETRFGLDTVDAIISQLENELTNKGAYTSVGNYPHGELLAMAVALTKLTGKDMPTILEDFAAHLMAAFRRMHPEYFDRARGVFDFLMSVEDHIHSDVRKLYPESRPPLVKGRMRDDGCMVLDYQSSRPLAGLAYSLTALAGIEFGQPLDITVLAEADDGCAMTLLLEHAE